MNPTQVAQNHTARIHADSPMFQAFLAAAEEFTGPDFCHVCGRCTDHYGEHSDEQLARFASSPKGTALIRKHG